MNYYNPYFYSIPMSSVSTAPAKVGLLGRLFGRAGITLGGILNGTQRALNFANQAIPLIKQVRPMVGNAKTMFKVMNEFKRVEKPKKQNTETNNIIDNNTNITSNNEENVNVLNNNSIEQTSYSSTDDGPTFFM